MNYSVRVSTSLPLRSVSFASPVASFLCLSSPQQQSCRYLSSSHHQRGRILHFVSLAAESHSLHLHPLSLAYSVSTGSRSLVPSIRHGQSATPIANGRVHAPEMPRNYHLCSISGAATPQAPIVNNGLRVFAHQSCSRGSVGVRSRCG